MRLEDFQRKEFDDYFGLWARGETDQVPEEYFSDTLNTDFNDGEWKTRPGISNSIVLGYGAGNGKVRRFASFADPSIGGVTLILDDAGNLYTYSTRTGDNATSVRLAMGGSAIDFSAIKMLNKIYLAFHNGATGLNSINLKVFILGALPANDEIRDAAGLAPTAGGSIGAADGAAGIVNAGIYKIAVSYVTSSGFVTQPGPKIAGVFTATTYTAPGSKKINLSSIPTGPAGTVQRQILITQVDGEEYFYLPSAFGGLINDNTTTTATLNFDDTTDLVDSADSLFDLLETIPTPLALQDYSGKLCTAGEYNNNSIIRVSNQNEPESFDSIDGIVPVSKDDGFTIRNLLVMRGALYAWKNLGLHAVRDNGDIPANWPVDSIDETVNVGIHGIAEFFDLSGIRVARDWTLVADKSGILLFDGAVRKPPITYNINDLWQTINFAVYEKIVLVVDEQNHKIYCAIPTGANTNNNKLLMADYNLCPGNFPSVSKIKWSVWSFGPAGSPRNPTEIGLFGVSPDTVPTLKIGSIDGGGKIWKLDPTVTTDEGSSINSYFTTALIFWASGYVHFFTAVRLRLIGSGTILVNIYGLDEVISLSAPTILPTATPGQEVLIRFNFQNEKAKIKFNCSGRFVMSKLEIFGKPIYSMRPA